MTSTPSSESLLTGEPLLALAPMKDMTDRLFWKLIASYGGADLYFTEFFRVHGSSRPEKWILDSLIHNPTGRPAIAQMIGNDIPALVRNAKELQQYPIAGIDLNLGCPAPVVYRKCAGGGLLRDPKRVDTILGALRDAVQIKFTVKTRIGFDDPAVFDELLPIFAKHSLDLLTVHGRTVAGGYHSEVDYNRIAQAVAAMPCPVLANGNISSIEIADEILRITHAGGLMIGRGVVRNPWLFQQIRQHRQGLPVFQPRGWDLLNYVQTLYEEKSKLGFPELELVQAMKKFMNFIGIWVNPQAPFLYEIRRVNTKTDFFRVCKQFLAHNEPLSLNQSPAC